MTDAKPNRDPETLDVIDNLQRTSGQLAALLTAFNGEGAERFHALIDDDQDRIIDLAACLAGRIKEAAGRL